VRAALQVIKGEFTLVIGPVVTALELPDLPARYRQLLEAGHSPSRAIKILAAEARLSKRDIYRLIHGGP